MLERGDWWREIVEESVFVREKQGMIYHAPTVSAIFGLRLGEKVVDSIEGTKRLEVLVVSWAVRVAI